MCKGNVHVCQRERQTDQNHFYPTVKVQEASCPEALRLFPSFIGPIGLDKTLSKAVTVKHEKTIISGH